MFTDAEANSPQPAGRWGTVGLVFGFTGVIVYFYVGRGEASGDRRTEYEKP